MNDPIRSADRWIALRAHAIVGDAPAMMHLFEKSIGTSGNDWKKAKIIADRDPI
jgi:hypothetical protein